MQTRARGTNFPEADADFVQYMGNVRYNELVDYYDNLLKQMDDYIRALPKGERYRYRDRKERIEKALQISKQNINNKVSTNKKLDVNCLFNYKVLSDNKLEINFFIDEVKNSNFKKTLNCTNQLDKRLDFTIYNVFKETEDYFRVGIPPHHTINLQ